MNLFNKVKKGMIESTKAIKEISSDMTEITKLKLALSKDQDSIDDLYFNLGQVMYEYYEDNSSIDHLPESVMTALVDIRDTLQRIKDYEAKIELLKGIIKCDHCGNELDDKAKFCSNCGARLGALELEEVPQEEVPQDAYESDPGIEEVQDFEEIKPE